MKNNKKLGFGLIGILLIIGILLLTAGGMVVWVKKVAPTPVPVLNMNSSPSVTMPLLSPTPAETALISCQIDRDCPPSLGCWPLSEQCPTQKCVNAQCIQVNDEDTLKKLTDSMRCQKDQDCAYLCRGSKAVIDYSQPFSWCRNREYMKSHLVACLDVYVPPLGTCQCLNKQCQLIPN